MSPSEELVFQAMSRMHQFGRQLVLLLVVSVVAAMSAAAQCEKLSEPKLTFTSKQMLKRLEHRTDIAVPPGARIHGTVAARVYLNSDGSVECVQVLHGHPLLTKPVRESLFHWRFRAPRQKAVGDLYITWKNGWTLK